MNQLIDFMKQLNFRIFKANLMKTTLFAIHNNLRLNFNASLQRVTHKSLDKQNIRHNVDFSMIDDRLDGTIKGKWSTKTH